VPRPKRRLDRRTFLRLAAGGALSGAAACASASRPSRKRGEWVNDVHSALNRTWVAGVERPTTLAELRAAVRAARSRGHRLCVAGGRHAMGGQQFATGATLVDVRALDRVIGFDPASGLLEVEAGIQWPALYEACRALPGAASRAPHGWGFRQKQTGADRLTLAGTLAANGHGRGLAFPPFVSDVDSFVLIGADAVPRTCSRSENPELFALAAGGYGLFGVVSSLRLRLAPRRKLERVVEIATADRLAQLFAERIAAGYLYGDFQFTIDPTRPDFLARGVFSCYRPVDDDRPMPEQRRELDDDTWRRLLAMAHENKAGAFDLYAAYYLTTTGQLYWSDEHQLAAYFDGYHAALDALRPGRPPASEVITELYVPRPRIAEFLAACAEELRARRAEVIYGTVRLIERDTDTVLPWARESYACVIFNLHVEHGEEGERAAADSFRALIDLATARGGSYFLTYHRHARRDQVEACYPRFVEFLRAKRRHDPDEVFQSDWYRHYRRMFGARV
jgi:FAD/FMN-containing dehydrogenase